VQADDNGSTFLYVEQQQGAMLSVYDVTNPGRIKLEASVPTGAHKRFDFVSAIGDSELIAFRDGSGKHNDQGYALSQPQPPQFSAAAFFSPAEFGWRVRWAKQTRLNRRRQVRRAPLRRFWTSPRLISC
jgi:hypothetical protein